MLSVQGRLQGGTTLLELMVTVTIVAILLAVGVPQLSDWIRRNSVSSAAEVLQNGLRGAEAEAIRRNAPAEFLLTNDTPSASGTLAAVDNGKNWAIRMRDSSFGIVTGGYVAGFSLKEVSADVVLSGPASVLFNGMGRTLDSTGAALTAAQVYRFSRDGADKAFCVFVTPGGSVKLCDPSLASGNPRACQPLLTLSQCPTP